MTMKIRMLLAMAAGAALFAMPAAAQLSSEGGPIAVNSDRTETLERQNKVLVIGNVDIQQGTARLRANKVTLLFAGNGQSSSSGLASGFGEIKTMIAEEEVFYVTPEVKATGDRATYDNKSGVITMTGNIKLMRSCDVATGEVLKIETASGRSTLDGGSGRVKMVLDPSADENSSKLNCET